MQDEVEDALLFGIQLRSHRLYGGGEAEDIQGDCIVVIVVPKHLEGFGDVRGDVLAVSGIGEF